MTSLDNILPILYDADFDKDEATIYHAMLELGPSTVTSIAGQAHIDRMKTFRILKRLLARKVIDISIIGKRKHYFPKNPESLLLHFEERKRRIVEKQDRLKEAINNLLTLYHHGGSRPFITYHEGSTGFRSIYEKILHEMAKAKDKTIRIYSPAYGALYRHFTMYFPTYPEKKVKLRLSSKTISCKLPTKEEKKLYKKLLDTDQVTNERHYIHEGFFFPTFQYILENTVIYFSLENDYCLGTIITHNSFCESQKKIFDFVWQHSVPEKKYGAKTNHKKK